MKMILSFVVTSLVLSLTSQAFAIPLNCDNDTYVVMVSHRRTVDANDFAKALYLLKSLELAIKDQSTINSERVMALIENGSSALPVLTALSQIPGVIIECVVYHHADPRLTGTN
ncbi:MAG TPA: hypothetical protein VN132_15880 [Bdellovibrio sp.]|nr:hypothetical protein [Bdellovibrio sp.]